MRTPCSRSTSSWSPLFDEVRFTSYSSLTQGRRVAHRDHPSLIISSRLVTKSKYLASCCTWVKFAAKPGTENAHEEGHDESGSCLCGASSRRSRWWGVTRQKKMVSTSSRGCGPRPEQHGWSRSKATQRIWQRNGALRKESHSLVQAFSQVDLQMSASGRRDQQCVLPEWAPKPTVRFRTWTSAFAAFRSTADDDRQQAAGTPGAFRGAAPLVS